MISKTHRPTEKEELGTWQASICSEILGASFFVLYQGTLGLLPMSLKLHQS